MDDTRTAYLLALPLPGAPVTFEQVEERVFTTGSAGTTLKTRTYRDSFGRIRIERTIAEGASGTERSIDLIEILDPVAALRFVLVTSGGEKVAYRRELPKSDANFFALSPGPLTSGELTVRTEALGTREIEGIEFEGSRVIETSKADPQVTRTIEHWLSAGLHLLALLSISSPGESYVVRIQKLRRQEPDPLLFVVPAGYRSLDLRREL
jgi:hypothetical protein